MWEQSLRSGSDIRNQFLKLVISAGNTCLYTCLREDRAGCVVLLLFVCRRRLCRVVVCVQVQAVIVTSRRLTWLGSLWGLFTGSDPEFF